MLLLDTASLYYRAFYGLPTTLRAPDGTVSNAVRGLLDFVSTLQTNYQPDVIVACWDDDWRPDWRVELIASYKAHRVMEEIETTVGIEIEIEETPDELAPQIPAIAEGLGLLGIPVIGVPGAEADDVIGTLTHKATGPVDIITGDRDLFQLINDEKRVRVLYTAKGVSKLDVYDDAALFDRFGVHANQYVDFAVLKGDPSDGLPGVAGIGDKTAALLLGKYQNIAGIEAAAADPNSEIKPRARENLLASAEYLIAARKVVTVRPDLKIKIPTMRRPNKAGFAEFSDEWGLGSVAERALKAFG